MHLHFNFVLFPSLPRTLWFHVSLSLSLGVLFFFLGSGFLFQLITLPSWVTPRSDRERKKRRKGGKFIGLADRNEKSFFRPRESKRGWGNIPKCKGDRSVLEKITPHGAARRHQALAFRGSLGMKFWAAPRRASVIYVFGFCFGILESFALAQGEQGQNLSVASKVFTLFRRWWSARRLFFLTRKNYYSHNFLNHKATVLKSGSFFMVLRKNLFQFLLFHLNFKILP